MKAEYEKHRKVSQLGEKYPGRYFLEISRTGDGNTKIEIVCGGGYQDMLWEKDEREKIIDETLLTKL